MSHRVILSLLLLGACSHDLYGDEPTPVAELEPSDEFDVVLYQTWEPNLVNMVVRSGWLPYERGDEPCEFLHPETVAELDGEPVHVGYGGPRAGELLGDLTHCGPWSLTAQVSDLMDPTAVSTLVVEDPSGRVELELPGLRARHKVELIPATTAGFCAGCVVEVVFHAPWTSKNPDIYYFYLMDDGGYEHRVNLPHDSLSDTLSDRVRFVLPADLPSGTVRVQHGSFVYTDAYASESSAWPFETEIDSVPQFVHVP